MSEQIENGIAPATFNLDAWIDGTCGLTRLAKIYQRGDLFPRLDKLERQIEAAGAVAKKERGVSDDGVDELVAEYEALAEQLTSSALTVHVQDRTETRRRHIRDKLKKDKLDPENPDDSETISLHVVADAIIKVETPDGRSQEYPDGFPPNKLREIKDRLGDAALYDVMDAYRKVTMEAPTVAAPLLRRSSSGRGGIT